MASSAKAKVRCAHSQTFSFSFTSSRHTQSGSNTPSATSHQHEVYLQQSHSQGSQHGTATHEDDMLPFFPRFESQWLCDEKLLVAWFEPHFAQAKYNLDPGNNGGSNACTLIAVLLSSYCSSEKVLTTCTHNQISYCIIKALGIAMLNGNEIYNRLKREGQLPNVNLSIPEAISCAGKFASRIKEWKSVLYMQSLSDSLFTNTQGHLDEWNASAHAQRHNYLYIILISDARSVLFINNRKDNSITLVDSHQHSAYKGAAIAVVNKANFRCLCNWFVHILQKYNQSNPGLYELSFLYYRRK